MNGLSSIAYSRYSETDLARFVDLATEPSVHLTDAWPDNARPPLAYQALWHLVDAEGLARRGETERADGAFRQGLEALAAMNDRSISRRQVEARYELVLARRAFRVGDTVGYRTHISRARSRIDRLPIGDRSIRLALVELESAVATKFGQYDKAARHLRQSEALATLEGLPWVSRIHRALGSIHARCGRPVLAAHAYQTAASRLTEEDAPIELARVCDNLAMASLMAGEVDAAHSAIERSLRLRKAHHAPIADIASATAVIALIKDRQELPDAAAWWDEAISLSRQGPELMLVTEIELRAANSAARRGDVASCRALLETASGRLTSMGRSVPKLGAMLHEARARLLFCEKDLETARTEARRAHQGYAARGAIYHVARMELLQGLILHALGLESQACQYFDSACRRALRGRFELGVRSYETAPLQAAAFRGEQHVRRYCRAMGIEADEQAGVLLLDRFGSIECFGKHHALGRNALPFRIARFLYASQPDGLPMPALCKKLWPAEGHSPRTANRLRVHVHRLRELIGPEKACVLTDSVTRAGVTSTRYYWNPEVPVRLVRGAR
jgi:tetratricopeptide (TPR) repeat protein